MTTVAATAAATAVRRAEVQHRLDELEWLLDGGVWPPTACARVGWSVDAAATERLA